MGRLGAQSEEAIDDEVYRSPSEILAEASCRGPPGLSSRSCHGR